jgi:hypothetical protein
LQRTGRLLVRKSRSSGRPRQRSWRILKTRFIATRGRE